MLGEDFTRAEKRQLRELADKAYERELGEALRDLKIRFAQWEGGKITAFDLSESIHEFHNGIARELFKSYDNKLEAFNVARALRDGILARDDIPPPLRAKVKALIARFPR